MIENLYMKLNIQMKTCGFRDSVANAMLKHDIETQVAGGMQTMSVLEIT